MSTQTKLTMETSPNAWAQTYPVKYYELDINKVLKPSALMNFLQDMATKNAEMLGFGPTFVFENGYAWFLIKYHMEFDDYPCDLDEIVIKTEPRGITKIIANRDFEIRTAENKRLGRIASQWMLVDIGSRSVLPLAKVAPQLMLFEKREDDLQFTKIPAPENYNFEKNFDIRFDDIDINRHVNNSNYIVWAFEALPYEFRGKYKLKTLDVVYKKEIAYGHSVISQAVLDVENKTSIHVVKNASNGEDLCLVNACWQ